MCPRPWPWQDITTDVNVIADVILAACQSSRTQHCRLHVATVLKITNTQLTGASSGIIARYDYVTHSTHVKASRLTVSYYYASKLAAKQRLHNLNSCCCCCHKPRTNSHWWLNSKVINQQKPPNLPSNQHLHLFSRLCRAPERGQQTDRQTHRHTAHATPSAATGCI